MNGNLDTAGSETGTTFNVSGVVDHLISALRGSRYGFFETLNDCGSLTAGELAFLCGRSARETQTWLNRQVANGVMWVLDGDGPEREHRYALPRHRAALLVEVECPLDRFSVAA